MQCQAASTISATSSWDLAGCLDLFSENEEELTLPTSIAEQMLHSSFQGSRLGACFDLFVLSCPCEGKMELFLGSVRRFGGVLTGVLQGFNFGACFDLFAISCSCAGQMELFVASVQRFGTVLNGVVQGFNFGDRFEHLCFLSDCCQAFVAQIPTSWPLHCKPEP